MSYNLNISPGSTIGIIGGGQLGKMMATAASQLGYKTHIFTNNINSPAAQVSNKVTVANYNNHEKLVSFASSVDVATIEFENIDSNIIDIILQKTQVYPNKKTLSIAQNRIKEKTHMQQLGIKVADFVTINNYENLIYHANILGYPLILKTATLGYDGKGQYFIKNQSNLKQLSSLNWNQEYILEKFINIYKEISSIIVTGVNNTSEFFPIAENYHINGILDKSIVPAKIHQDIYKQAQMITLKIAQSLNIIGILTVEFFITYQQKLLVNEIAPRPHNSGHWSLNACNISQFEQLINAICGLPLKPIKLLFPCTMQNILGQDIYNHNNYIKMPNYHLTIYGKEEAHDNRKMGHINIMDY
ncbi:5-(carboxyamino)imidazole ribonucleotide synthase [Neoehrlichia mikurensis]|uniref:N5-carboxyaminoimidazole ribonucleotide synthase n=1 Tax=Neoehrlichia mikurensis TaxID=89586 RepID=A0A9Q9F4B8_9RICK|nr:5-(carboxyamino)imidazole ribonucleotide synthase [Neoehrlichia mikurensis]QXK91653.1 5-(carboxyamino)imidazole ribonucleotide synthase [Neoehrlichia mikurensis]QXK92864.1 5-(carboxyamino)imidazole ribonucleotide synthase [Neoehrlichia mikurensis]QXK93344.1 5-(carboxyamino)imidazole ribonucleotide synthase [Neoehrlichia mikurensis]UTO55713.1 5-(carboxyamino)imidazole ribonucleotide synthase [Neoehrlichia mikurensis]UTO56630.1 5-(carboxyamino)imidazole ribonucleotide synthase [Neoehrlichia m